MLISFHPAYEHRWQNIVFVSGHKMFKSFEWNMNSKTAVWYGKLVVDIHLHSAKLSFIVVLGELLLACSKGSEHSETFLSQPGERSIT